MRDFIQNLLGLTDFQMEIYSGPIAIVMAVVLTVIIANIVKDI